MRRSVALASLFLALAGRAAAVDLATGDIVVVAAGSGLVRIDPATGEQELIASGGLLAFPFCAALDAAGDLIVADREAFGGSGGVIRVDPASGAQASIAAGGFFTDPHAVAIGADGDLFVTDGAARVVRVDPATVDDDGDGLVDKRTDGSGDPGCFDLSAASLENPACQNGGDDDGDGKIDFDGGAAANGGVPLGPPDPQCTIAYRTLERPPTGCGIGIELALALPLLAALRRSRAPRSGTATTPRGR
jgi:hypothetical protein